jgi:hypothetical protein
MGGGYREYSGRLFCIRKAPFDLLSSALLTVDCW